MRRLASSVRVLTAFTLLGFGPGLILLAGGKAWGQFGPGGGMRPMGQGGMGGMGPNTGAPQPEKPEGPAEEAPEKTAPDVATEALPAWPGQREKSLQFFQLNGYLRGRGYYWYNLNLGHYNDPTTTTTTPRANPFTIPYSELPLTNAGGAGTQQYDPSCHARTGGDCRSNDIKTADMRFRLEPTLNLSDQVRIKAQIDIFDNLVLGSTPDGYYVNGRAGYGYGSPSIINSRGQVPPQSGINSLNSSINAKRAWGEVKTPLFELRFGRMPLSWGAGMLFNDGNCNDCDYGVTVDRIMATAKLWGHFVSLSWDWGATGPTSNIVWNQQLIGWNYVADNVADVYQWTLALGRIDDEARIKQEAARGAVFNYGLFMMLRTQDWALRYNPAPQTSPYQTAQSTMLYPPVQAAESLAKRGAWSLTPDIWARLDWRKLHLEAEGAAIFGNIGNLDIQDPTTGAMGVASVSLLQFGGLVRGHYKLLHDSLTIGTEVGSASGPQNGDTTGELNWQRAQESAYGSPGNNGMLNLSYTRFAFDPDYHVDLILFRRILGTVYNATYIKPSVTYWLIDNFGGQAEVIYSLANRPATFPGHSINMGMELNARLMYRNQEEGFYAMLEYGVLFNLGALEQHEDVWGPPRWGAPVGSTTAQVFQAKVMLKF